MHLKHPLPSIVVLIYSKEYHYYHLMQYSLSTQYKLKRIPTWEQLSSSDCLVNKSEVLRYLDE